MKRTTIFLPEDLHAGLKYIALDHNQSMATLLREAIEKVYKDDLKDISLAIQARKKHKKNPETVVSARKFFNEGD